MKDDLPSAFKALKERYGTHCLAAQAIGIDQDHYRKLRNGRASIPTRTADYILLKAQEIAADMPPPAESSEASEARP